MKTSDILTLIIYNSPYEDTVILNKINSNLINNFVETEPILKRLQ